MEESEAFQSRTNLELNSYLKLLTFLSATPFLCQGGAVHSKHCRNPFGNTQHMWSCITTQDKLVWRGGAIWRSQNLDTAVAFSDQILLHPLSTYSQTLFLPHKLCFLPHTICKLFCHHVSNCHLPDPFGTCYSIEFWFKTNEHFLVIKYPR